jgi:HIP---CoA ligase
VTATIPGLAAAAAERFGDRTAVVDGDVSLTYGELLDAARRFAGGIAPGSRVAIWAPNSWRWIVAALGLWEAGATLVPINTRFKAAEANLILERSDAALLVTVGDFLGVDYAAMADTSSLSVLRIDTDEWDAFGGPPPNVAVAPDDWSDILFTSGTTGTPKGVVQTHGRTLQVATDWVAMTGLTAGDRYLMVNPYFHMFGLKAGILACIAAGATMLPEPVFEVDRVLERVAKEAVTVLPGAPTVYQAILDHPDRDKHDLSSLRVAVTGAADIPVELIRRIKQELPFSVIITGYGLTEAGTASATSPDDDFETIATTVGRARPGFELRIVDGEILLRGGSVMSHYLDDPEATKAALDEEGWLRTGDLGEIDENGCVRIIGRSKDMFIVGGFNAYPAEIENALLRHPDIAQVAVIGIPDDRLGEVGMAFVVPRPGASPTEAEIVAWCRDDMANYKVPRRVEFIEALPLNATGKVVKDELRARVSST